MKGLIFPVTTLITISTTKFLKPDQVSKQGRRVSEIDKDHLSHVIYF